MQAEFFGLSMGVTWVAMSLRFGSSCSGDAETMVNSVMETERGCFDIL